MFLDNLIQFSSAQAVASTTTSAGTYDVTGAGVSVTPNMAGGVTSTSGTLIGFDIGAGDGAQIPEVYWNVTTAFTSAAGASLAIQLQASADSGNNTPALWQTVIQTPPIPVAQLAANTNGQFQVPPVPPGFGEVQPRFYRLNYVVSSSTFSAGAISANLVINPQQSTKIQLYPSNFVA